MAAALAAAATDEQMEFAVQAVVRDRYDETTANSRASWLRTWTTFHKAAYASLESPPPVFPLTSDSILRVAALFKAEEYFFTAPVRRMTVMARTAPESAA